jgi:PAS domain S-box-containing protein
MLKLYFNTCILGGFILALAILSWLAITSFLNTGNFIWSSCMATKTAGVLFNTARVIVSTANINTGQWGNGIASEWRIKKSQTSLKTKPVMGEMREIAGATGTEERLLKKNENGSPETQTEKFNYTLVSLLIVTGLILTGIYLMITITWKGKKEAEKRLQLIAAETHDLYDNAPCGYHSLDANGSFVNINSTLLRWLGYDRNEVVGTMKFTDVIPPEDHALFWKSFKTSAEISNIEFNFIRKNGSRFPVALSVAAIRNASGDYVKSRAMTLDITERKQAEAKVKHLNLELEAFTYSVSHDLRAPLRSIDGYAKILQEDYHDKLDDEGKRVIHVIMNNARRMGTLIDDLLAFSRLGRKDMLLASLNMTQFVKNIAQELVGREQGRTIDLRVSPLLPACADADMIRQVWENLLSNAIKFTGRASPAFIEVNSSETESEIIYSIRDNGVGFDMQYVGKLYNVFQRLHKIQDFSGTGVGLAIVKRIIDRHRGRVWAESQINVGATFYFTLPKQT